MDLEESRQFLARAWADAEASGAPLQSQLDRYVAASRDVIPDVMAVYDRMVARLQHAGAGAEAPAVGDMLPDMLLPDAEGHLVPLSALHASGPLVVSFNRGHWCPYCRMELRALKRVESALAGAGAKLVSIVPETAVYSSRMIETNAFAFPVLSDVDLAYALRLALAVWIGDEMTALYESRGIDLARFQGNAGAVLPIPATFVVAAGGRIRARFVDPEFRHRMPVEEILCALDGAGQSRP